MNQRLNMLQNLIKWFEKQTQTRRDLIFPVPVATTQHHLKIAFASTINISRGFLSARYKYNGEINDTEINVEFTVSGRGEVDYNMHGKLFFHQKGSQLVMIVRVKEPLLFFIGPLAFIFFALCDQQIGFTIFAALFLIICFPVMRWHLNSAANDLSALIKKIVAATPSSFVVS